MNLEWSHRLYRLLLYAYPAAFRRDYGREMAQLFRDTCRELLSEDRGLGLWNLWLPILSDLLPSAVAERRRALLTATTAGWHRRSLVQGAIVGAVLGLGASLPWGTREDLLVGPIMGATAGTAIGAILGAMKTPDPASDRARAGRIMGAFGGGVTGMSGGALFGVWMGSLIGPDLGAWLGGAYTGGHAAVSIAVLALGAIAGMVGGAVAGSNAGVRTTRWAGSILVSGE